MTTPIERAFHLAAGLGPNLCDSCGAPRSRMFRLILVEAEEEEEDDTKLKPDPHRRCSDCGRPVTEDGRADGSFQGRRFVQNVIQVTAEDPPAEN